MYHLQNKKSKEKERKAFAYNSLAFQGDPPFVISVKEVLEIVNDNYSDMSEEETYTIKKKEGFI